MNSIHTTVCDRHYGEWVFDDEKRGLINEPFVLGTSEAIDYVVGPAKKIKITHSANQFPHASHYLERLEPEDGGYWYQLVNAGTNEPEEIDENWLCPATKAFYDEHPRFIWIAIKNLNK